MIFRQKDTSNGTPIILDQAENEIASREHEDRIQQIQSGLESVDHCEIVLVEDSDLDVSTLLHKCHRKEYVEVVRKKSSELLENEVLFDKAYAEPGVKQDTPFVRGIYDTAISAFRTSVTAAKHLKGDSNACSYALCRPPGHHAAQAWMGGYCYFNNAVGAVFALREEGHSRVGLLDLDFHFGNGSAAILRDIPEVYFGSIHGSTLDNFPYRHTSSNMNRQLFISFCSSPTSEEYLSSVSKLIREAEDFGCSALVISIGYDIIAGDPHGKWDLLPEIYYDVGTILTKVRMPLCLIQEGGYHDTDLSKCAFHFMQGIMMRG
ncbi:hypothetical protein EEL31_06860 [Brevibacillus laterosporus]|nr:hypothetical protein [Brevibacillus laterosporus]TPG68274.1 hypothetical protein EEL31_06860 [Brevibacillus laterosporus]